VEENLAPRAEANLGTQQGRSKRADEGGIRIRAKVAATDVTLLIEGESGTGQRAGGARRPPEQREGGESLRGD
jgi:DNA-binding NtrC family response regulator